MEQPQVRPKPDANPANPPPVTQPPEGDPPVNEPPEQDPPVFPEHDSKKGTVLFDENRTPG